MDRNEERLDSLLERTGLPLATEETYLAAYEQAARRAAGRQYLVFTLGTQAYGLALEELSELRRYQPPTPVPGTKPFVLGVVGIRGQVVTLVDLARRIGLQPVQPGPQARILVLGGEDPLGLLVSQVRGVETLAEEELEPPPPALSAATAQYILGVGKGSQGDWIAILDPDKILDFRAVAE